MKTRLILGLMMASTSICSVAMAAGPNFCRRTAASAVDSCKVEGRSDQALAEGKCNNLPDVTAGKACKKQAAVDAQEFRQSCDEIDDLRKEVCDRLGPAAYAPVISPANFSNSTTIDNPYFPLVPGTTFVYEGAVTEEPTGFEHVDFIVTHTTKVVQGIPCVEVHDVRKLNGEVVEDTRDWFAQDDAGNVWYFGENTTLVDGGLPTDLQGSWTGGIDGAQPGLIMEAHPAIGDFYRQEFLLSDAEDLAEVTGLTDTVTVPYGTFTNALRITESSPIAPGDISPKFYAAGVGNLLTVEPNGDRSELVQIITEAP